MASPQKEDGYTAVANELVERLALAPLSGAQFRLLWVILRKTYGWCKKTDAISVAQFAEATGLHRKLVERELRELARRRYILAWGDAHHPKTYGVQKDYTVWDGKEVGTKSLPLDADKVGTKSLPSGNQIAPKVGTKSLHTKEKKEKNTESHDSAASGTLRERYERQYQEATNKIAVIGELFSLLLGGEPDYRRLGAMAKGLNSGGKLMDLIIDASKQRISDDPHDYLAGMVKRHKTESRFGRNGQADLNSAAKGTVVI